MSTFDPRRVPSPVHPPGPATGRMTGRMTGPMAGHGMAMSGRPGPAPFGALPRDPFARRGPAGPGGPPLPPPPSLTPPPREPRRRPVGTKVIAGVLLAGIVVGGGVWGLGGGSSSSASVQPVSSVGDAPTTAPVGADVATVSVSQATGPQAGDTPGLYASTEPASCDNDALVAQLQADPDKAAAWAGVFGLRAAGVPAFVASLEPVVLRAPTAITDHPYRDDAFVAEPAVLAAGTAVLIDSYGAPTVKCMNGNPLTAGAETAGAVVVQSTQSAITRFRFTSVDASRPVSVPATPPQTGPNPGTPMTPQADPVLAAQARASREAAAAAATRSRIAHSGLTSLQTDLEVLRQQQNALILASQDTTKTPAERQAAQTQLTALSTQIVDKQHAITEAAQAADAAQADADAAEERARQAEQARDASVRPRPATGTGEGEPGQTPAGEVQPDEVQPDEAQPGEGGAGGTQTGGTQTGGTQTGGTQTGGTQTGGTQTGGTQTGGAQTGGAQTGGAQTGGAQQGTDG